MYRSIIVCLVPAFVMLLNACAAPVEVADIELEPMGKKPVTMAPLAAVGSDCKVDADCMPTEKLCGVAACVESACVVVALQKGEACQSGVGVCDAFGECQKVVGICKAWDGPALNPCDDPSECDDGTPCTEDTCEAGWCHHDPLPDGKACGSSLSCNQGLCCVPS